MLHMTSLSTGARPLLANLFIQRSSMRNVGVQLMKIKPGGQDMICLIDLYVLIYISHIMYKTACHRSFPMSFS